MKYAVIALLTFVAFKSSAQNNLHSYALKRSLFQDDLQFLFTVLESGKRGVLNYDSGKMYYWMKAQRVVATQGASSGDLLHGTFEAFYQNKQLARKGSFNRGLKNGKWQYWRADGTLLKSEKWNNGAMRGKQVFYDSNGKVSESTHVGWFSTTRRTQDSLITYKSGAINKVITFDSTGAVSTIENWKNNQWHGVVKTYENGKCIEKQHYKNGELVVKEEDSEPTETSDTEEKAPLKEKIQKLFNRKDKEKKEPAPRKDKKEKKEKQDQE